MHWLLALASLAALVSPVWSLYFFLEGSQTRCFLEDLPKDTLVVGDIPPPARVCEDGELTA
jgi:p24 family protein alpha